MFSTPLSQRGVLLEATSFAFAVSAACDLSPCSPSPIHIPPRPPAPLLMPFVLFPSTGKLGTLALISALSWAHWVTKGESFFLFGPVSSWCNGR